MEFPYEVKPKIYLGKSLDAIGSKEFEEMFKKTPVIKLYKMPICQPVEVEVEVEIEKDVLSPLDQNNQDFVITVDEVKPEVEVICSNELDLSCPTSVLHSDSYFLRTRETKKPRYVDDSDELTLKIYSDYLEKVPVLRIEKLSQELFHQGLQRLEELRQNKDLVQVVEDEVLDLDPNGIKQEIDESQNGTPQVERQSLQLKVYDDEDDDSSDDYSSSSSNESVDEFKSVKNKKKKNKKHQRVYKKVPGYYKRGLFTCKICSREFNRSNNHALHLETHETNREKNVICQVCKKGFYNENCLRQHMKWAHNEDDKGKEFLCPHCGKIYLKRREFQLHLTSHLKEYKCEHCTQVFTRKMYLRSHQELHRDDKSKIKCEKCVKKFSSKQSLKNHNLKIHNDVTILSCTFEDCGKSFRGKINLENHQKTHEEASIKCPHCPLLYKTKMTIRQHVVLKHQDKLNYDHKCTFENCSRSFYSSLILERHLKEHETRANKPTKSYLCTQCGKAFKTKVHLDNHLISHGSEKNFKCSHEGCDKVFKYPAHSRTHFRIDHEMNDEERAQYFKEIKEKRSAYAKAKARQSSKFKETETEKTTN